MNDTNSFVFEKNVILPFHTFNLSRRVNCSKVKNNFTNNV